MGAERRDRRRELSYARLVVRRPSWSRPARPMRSASLSNTKTPAYPPRAFRSRRAAGPAGSRPWTDQDDLQRRHHRGWVGVGTQLDGLGHIGVEHVYYNGNSWPISPISTA